MSRELPEWIGKNDDSPIPPRVRVRVFERYGGRCHRSGRLIRAGERWEVDHVIALANGGEHRERNLAPILADKHREKTAQDVAEKSRTYRKRAAHVGVKFAPRQKIESRGFNPVQSQRRASGPVNKWRGVVR